MLAGSVLILVLYLLSIGPALRLLDIIRWREPYHSIYRTIYRPISCLQDKSEPVDSGVCRYLTWWLGAPVLTKKQTLEFMDEHGWDREAFFEEVRTAE